jgi:hypothetical protein
MRDCDELIDLIAENDARDLLIRKICEYTRSPNQSLNPFPLRAMG